MGKAEEYKGNAAGTITEDNNYLCQKLCHPAARAYTATIELPGGGSYKVDRPFSLGSFCLLPMCQPEVKVFEGTTHIGTITQVCCPAYLCKFEVDIHKGTEVADATRIMKIRKCGINCHTCCAVSTCGICGKELEFEIEDGQGQAKSDVALKKIHSSCLYECCTAGDLYQFTVPSDKQEAALFIAAVQFMDMLYFENPWSFSA